MLPWGTARGLALARWGWLGVTALSTAAAAAALIVRLGPAGRTMGQLEPTDEPS